ncbi:MAG: class I SAM-dependent methyltransferase [Methanolobus sp.]|nr:class I SAM-dependent methyltransferase [Methanolobus sp.]
MDIINIIPTNFKPLNVLEVGCSTGSTGAYLKQKYNCRITGIDVSEEAAIIANSKLDKVIIADLDRFDYSILKSEKFDLITFGDVLEHVKDPWNTLRCFRKFLNDDGYIILSIPNVRHWSVIKNLLVGYWPYRERGIHDKTHLRFFTLKNIKELIEHTSLIEVNMHMNFRIIEAPSKINYIGKLFNLPLIKHFFIFQYITLCKKR